MIPLTTTEDLADLCTRLSTAEFITVDTEFLRESTYWPKLCLIQIASDDEAVAIDPLSQDMDLTPFFELMDNPGVLKVLHAARQDLEIFYNLSGKLPTPVFDTQVAAMVCGYGDSVGYETLVTKIARRPLDKSHRYTDWSRRPLTDAQIDYAIGDVTHLRTIYRNLSERLEQTGRSGWVEEEMTHLLNPAIYDIAPEDAWKRLKVRTNKPRFLGVLKEIAAWREQSAKERDIPRGRVMKDEVLFEIAAHPPTTSEGIERIRGIAKGFARSKAGRMLMESLENAAAIPDNQLPKIEKAKPQPATPPMADLLKVLLKVKCLDQDVAPRLVASSQELEGWAADPTKECRFHKGWREEIFGKDAQKLVDGALALTSNKGNIEVVEIE